MRLLLLALAVIFSGFAMAQTAGVAVIGATDGVYAGVGYGGAYGYDGYEAGVSTGVVPANCPCAAIATRSVTNDDLLLVLGSEEFYALDSLQIRNLNWRNSAFNYPSMFSYHNPMDYNRVNCALVRHGNPYLPYYQLNLNGACGSRTSVRVAGTQERLVNFPSGLCAADRSTLNKLAKCFCSLTPQQAIAMGYQPVELCVLGFGMVYINRAAIDGCLDPRYPEAFTFTRDGRIMSVQYIVQSNQPVSLFGQTFSPGMLLPNTQQLGVWLFEPNPNGFFSLTNSCANCQ